MTVQGLNHITFAVADLNRSTEFYTRVLGARLLLRGDKTVAGACRSWKLNCGRTETAALRRASPCIFGIQTAIFWNCIQKPSWTG